MNDCTLTSSENGTKVGQRTRNGSHWNCVGKDQDDFGSVEQASIGTSKMGGSMESNDGPEMNQEWNQVFAMMERVEVSDFVVKPSLEAHLCNRPIKGATQSYYHSPKSHESRKSNHVSNVGTHNHLKRNEVSDFDIKPSFEALLCNRSFKANTQSFYPSNRFMKHASESYSQSEKKVHDSKRKRAKLGIQDFNVSTTHICAIVCSKTTPNLVIIRHEVVKQKIRITHMVSNIMISQKSKLIIQEWKSIELESRASGLTTALRAVVIIRLRITPIRLRITPNHFISRIFF